MSESLKTRWLRWVFNFFPCYRGGGGRVEYIAADYSELRVRVKLSWRTRNYVGTIYGGSMYSAVDPIYMLMLIKRLGPEFIVWDKAARIRFRRPGRGVLRATCRVSDEEVEAILALLQKQERVDRDYAIELVDDNGEVCAEIEKTIHIRRKGSGA